MRRVFLVVGVFAFSTLCHCQIDENAAVINWVRNLLSPGGQSRSYNPSSESNCLFASLARRQSKINGLVSSLLPQSSRSNFLYGQCPVEEELKQFNDDASQEKIIGSTEAKPGEFPWMVSVYELESCNHVCGGTLINNQYVLVAAHSILKWKDPSFYGLVIGEHRISSLNFDERHRTVRRISIHPEYDHIKFHNDVALLQLQKPVIYSKYIRPACLLPKNSGVDRIESPTLIGDPRCTAMSWGISETTGLPTDVLMRVRGVIMPDFVCQVETLKNSIIPVYEGDSKFCVQEEVDLDTCMLSSGGPLICSINGTFSVVGVASYGPEQCSQPGQSRVYAKISHPVINDWIQKEVLVQ